MCEKLKKCYKRQTVSKQIGISVSVIFLIAAILISLFMSVIFTKIKGQQLDLPNGFFE